MQNELQLAGVGKTTGSTNEVVVKRLLKEWIDLLLDREEKQPLYNANTPNLSLLLLAQKRKMVTKYLTTLWGG